MMLKQNHSAFCGQNNCFTNSGPKRNFCHSLGKIGSIKQGALIKECIIFREMDKDINFINPVCSQEYSQYFVDLTKKFLENPYCDIQFQKELDFFMEYSQKYGKGKNLLEIGCGTGRTLIFLAREGYACRGVDFDPVQIKCADEIKKELNIENITFSVAKIGEEIFKEKEFDIIISNDLVEHLPEQELLKYFSQVNKLLHDNGIFLIHSKPLKYTYLLKKKFIFFILIFFFLRERLFNQYLKKLDYYIPRVYRFFTNKNLQNTWQDLPPGHCNPPDEDNIRNQLINCGFEVGKIHTCHQGTHKLSRYFRRIIKSKKLNTSIFIYCFKRGKDNSLSTEFK